MEEQVYIIIAKAIVKDARPGYKSGDMHAMMIYYKGFKDHAVDYAEISEKLAKDGWISAKFFKQGNVEDQNFENLAIDDVHRKSYFTAKARGLALVIYEDPEPPLEA